MLAFAMILGTFAFPVSADQSTYLEVGNELKGLGVISGVNEAGDLAEMEKLTREQALVVLTSLMGQMDAAKATEAEPGFADVPATHWAAKFVAYAKAQGWTSGVSETEFGLGKEVTTKEALSFMMRALGYTADWAKEDIMKKASELGLMEGVSAKAEDQLVRGELFIVMKNTLYTKPMGEKTELVYKLGLKENPVPETLEVVDVKAENLMEIVVEFNQEVDKDTLENAFSSVGLNLANVEANLLEDGKTVVLGLTQEMKNKTDYKITISKVKSLGGVMMEKVMKEFKTQDNETPKVADVVVTGPKTFNIKFSEPIKKEGSVKIKVEKKNGPGASVTRRGEKVFEVKTGSEMKDGTTYTLLISGFGDYANYNMIADERELEYAKVAVAPTVEVVKATQEYVVLKFDRPVKGLTLDNFNHTYSAWKPVLGYTSEKLMKADLADGIIGNLKTKAGALVPTKLESNQSYEYVVVRFLKTVKDFIKTANKDWHPLQVGDVEVNVLGQVGSRKVVDNWGNQLQDTEIMVNVTADKTAPVIESVEAVGENEVEITYSKDVIYDKANYEVLKADGSKFAGSFRSSSEEGRKIKLILEGQTLVGKTVILNVKNVRDNTINMNKLVGTESFNISFGDKKFEGIKEVYLKEPVSGEDVAKMFVIFKEAMDSQSATDINNYRFTTVWTNPEEKQFKIDADLSMFSDSIVQITMSKKVWEDNFKGKVFANKATNPATDKGMKIVVSKNVKDLAGNDNGGFTMSEFVLTNSTNPKLISDAKTHVQLKDAVVATGKTTIEMNFDQPLAVYGNTSTINPKNFKVDLGDGTYAENVESAEFAGDLKKQIVLTLKEKKELPTDLKNVRVRYVEPTPKKEDGQIINELELALETVETLHTNMTDKIAPEYAVVVAKDTVDNFNNVLYKFDGTKHEIVLTLTEEVKDTHVDYDTFVITGNDGEVYGVKTVSVDNTTKTIEIEFNVKDSQVEPLKERLDASLKSEKIKVEAPVALEGEYVSYFNVAVRSNHRVLDKNNNELAKDAVKVYHRAEDVVKYINADYARLSKLIDEVEQFKLDVKDKPIPTGAGNAEAHYAEYGASYVDTTSAEYKAVYDATTGKLDLAKVALSSGEKMKEKADELENAFNEVKDNTTSMASELEADDVEFKRSSKTVNFTHVVVKNLKADEKVKVIQANDNNAGILNIDNASNHTASPALNSDGDIELTNTYFAIVKVDKDGKAISYRRFVLADAITTPGLVGKKAEPTTLEIATATTGGESLTVTGSPIDLKANQTVELTGYDAGAPKDKVDFNVTLGADVEKITYVTEALTSGDLLDEAFAAAEPKEMNANLADVKFKGTGAFKITFTATKIDAEGDYIPQVYTVVVTVKP